MHDIREEIWVPEPGQVRRRHRGPKQKATRGPEKSPEDEQGACKLFNISSWYLIAQYYADTEKIKADLFVNNLCFLF